MDRLERFMGCLMGLAVGDALGTTVEFSSPGSFTPMTDIVGGGPFNLKPGEWTDDTSMALCLAESLIEKKKFDPIDQLDRYYRWYKEGHLSSNGRCFDIGNTTRLALETFAMNRQGYCGSTDRYAAGNGSLMRLAPVPLFFSTEPFEAIFYSGESSRTTHGAPEAIDACRYYGALIVAALSGESKETMVQGRYEPGLKYWQDHPLKPAIDEVARGTFKDREPPEIHASGYVVKSLEAALWAFDRSISFEQGCLMAVNLGDDADTCGAIFGQLAGAYYGLGGIPKKWWDRLALRDLIQSFAVQLHRLAWED